MREKADNMASRRAYILYFDPAFGEYYSTHGTMIISIKEFLYALHFNPPPDSKKYSPITVQRNMYYLVDLIAWAHAHGTFTFSEIEQTDIHEYITWLKNRLKEKTDKPRYSLKEIDRRIAVLKLYYEFARRVSDPLKVLPLGGKSVFAHVGQRRYGANWRENKTAVIPKEVWDPYLRAAHDYVRYFADDILQGRALLESMRGKNYVVIRAAFLRAGLQPSIHPSTGKPWRSPWASLEEFNFDQDDLYFACLIIVLSLSGMREGEIHALHHDGHSKELALDGVNWKYRLASRVVKNANRLESWVVTEVVHRAMEIAKELTSYARRESDAKHAFIVNYSPDYSKPIDPAKVKQFGAQTFNNYLNRFAKRVPEKLGASYEIPLVDGKPWNFTTRQYRRSLAGRIAAEPFGMIAGMLQYKHLQITTFEGYAGSDPTWHEELRDAENDANEEFLTHLWDDLQSGSVAGGKGDLLLKEFQGTAGEIKKDALQYFLESHRSNLHVGVFNYCFFDPEWAMCTKDKQDKDAKPMLNACQPSRCKNSCVTPKHIPAWQAQIDDANAMLKHKKVSVPQKISLTRDLEEALQIVNKVRATHE
ncbi:hypothetical protein [Noviherbaspirillum soli]|uniref:hypothetical protein n=1 Tax=Noviherbaspirillum soli TaxID=1064518 RepID=UPI00188C6334|nr:hypothetical protein [Noviherbaspirillum soli]